MTCERVRIAGGIGFVCHRGKRRVADGCKFCGEDSGFLCDFPKSKNKTCDAALCRGCAHELGPNTHYCFVHPRQSVQQELPLLPPELTKKLR